MTAGIGGLAYAGIPATHRDANAAVLFLTGHGADGDVAPVDWESIRVSGQAIVVYMPIGHLAEIARRLIDGGNPADTPAALVSRATTPEQRVVTGTLGTIVEAAARRGISPPTILVVGDIVDFHRELDWFPGEGADDQSGA